eukprot:2907451-Pleurochrysis_carterae.AAC.2
MSAKFKVPARLRARACWSACERIDPCTCAWTPVCACARRALCACACAMRVRVCARARVCVHVLVRVRASACVCLSVRNVAAAHPVAPAVVEAAVRVVVHRDGVSAALSEHRRREHRACLGDAGRKEREKKRGRERGGMKRVHTVLARVVGS